jgi:hypothetical protein
MNIGKYILAVAIAASMSACGGGGGGGTTSTPSPAEGLWQGTTSTNRAVSGFVLDDGTYWFLYSVAGSPSLIAGAAQGNASASNGSFSSSNGRDFNLEGAGISDFTMAGTYTARSSLGGTMTYSPSGTVTFANTYDPDYDLTPSLAAIAGNYTGAAATSAGVEATAVTISGSGAIIGSGAGGCVFTGSATPRARGNVYNVSVTFGGGACTLGTSTVTGIGHFDAATKLLRSAALNSSRTDGFIYIGTKP